MYLGALEIDSIEGNVVTFKNGSTIEISDKNKELITEEPIGGSELQDKWTRVVASQIVDVLFENDVRIADINRIITVVSETINAKNDATIVKLIGEEKLGTLSCVFGGSNIPELNIRNVRVKDIF